MFRRRRLCVNAAKVCTSCWYTQLVALGRIWISSTLLSQALKILGITLQHSKDFDLNSIWINSSFRKDAKENPHSDLNDQNSFHSTIDIWNAPRAGVQGVSKIWMTKLKSIMELEHYDSAKIEETVNWLHLYSSLWSVCILIFV